MKKVQATLLMILMTLAITISTATVASAAKRYVPPPTSCAPYQICEPTPPGGIYPILIALTSVVGAVS